MRSLVGSSWHLVDGVYSSCGLTVGNLWPASGSAYASLHSRGLNPMNAVYKPAGFTHICTQLGRCLCTSFPQLFSGFQSVISRFLHIIHRAYKEHCKLNKGTIL